MKHTSALDPFGAMASDYDQRFTNTFVGRLARNAVWQWLDQAFSCGDHVLELNCGTGEDAVHLASRGVQVRATDVSTAMLAVAKSKADSAGVAPLIQFERLSLTASSEPGLPVLGESYQPQSAFDGAFSNFGGLNVARQLDRVALGLHQILRPNARIVLVIMGPWVPWEWCWYMLRRRPATALRRLRRRGAEWHGVSVRYPSISALRRAFASRFRYSAVGAVGALVPPPYANEWATRHSGLVRWLNRWERRWERRWPLPWLADHYVIAFERGG